MYVLYHFWEIFVFFKQQCQSMLQAEKLRLKKTTRHKTMHSFSFYFQSHYQNMKSSPSKRSKTYVQNLLRLSFQTVPAISRKKYLQLHTNDKRLTIQRFLVRLSFFFRGSVSRFFIYSISYSIYENHKTINASMRCERPNHLS